MVKRLRPLGVVSLALTLSACSLFNSEEDVVVMAPVPQFAHEFDVQSQWQFQVGKGVDDYYSQLSPEAAYESIFAAERFGRVYALDHAGKKRWSVNLSKVESNNRFSGNTSNARISGGLTAAYQNIYLGTENADVFALDAATGEIRWQQRVPGEVIAKPVADDGTLVVVTGNGHLVALDALEGHQLWDIQIDQPALTLRGGAAPLVSQGVVFLGRGDGRMGLYSLKSGQQLFESKLASAKGSTEIDRLVDVDGQPQLIGQDVYAVAYNGSLISLDLSSGQVKWQRAYSAYQDMVLSGNELFITDSHGHIYAIERYQGSERWSTSILEYRNLTAAAVDGNYLLLGDADGYLYWFHRDTGELASKRLVDKAGLYVKPLVLADQVIVQTRSGKLIALNRA